MGQEKGIVIRKDTEAYMDELRGWLCRTEGVRLEEMADFFRARLNEYEEHMSLWKKAYEYLPSLLPGNARTLLDLGCGTGLELDEILKARPELSVTGVDLCRDMLERLSEKHPGVKLICGDYFQEELGEAVYDCAVSFESLHHFGAERKKELYAKLCRALKPGGCFIEADYIACCEEEERLLMEACRRKREQERIQEEQFVHFDTPLTAEHEMEALRRAGFEQVEMMASIEGATFIRAFRDRQADL